MWKSLVVLCCVLAVPKSYAFIRLVEHFLTGVGDMVRQGLGTNNLMSPNIAGNDYRSSLPANNYQENNFQANKLEHTTASIPNLLDHPNPINTTYDENVPCIKAEVTGIYKIAIGNRIVRVLCETETNGGKWTTIQSRIDGAVNFYKTFGEYQYGFGDPTTEFFIGLDNLHQMTYSKNMELLIIMDDFYGHKYTANYDSFRIGPPDSYYRLESLGSFDGDAGDSLRIHLYQSFSTWDMDNDASNENCAEMHEGAWWYNNCHESNLNGPYSNFLRLSPKGNGITWNGIKPDYPLMQVKMMIRPKAFDNIIRTQDY